MKCVHVLLTDQKWAKENMKKIAREWELEIP